MPLQVLGNNFLIRQGVDLIRRLVVIENQLLLEELDRLRSLFVLLEAQDCWMLTPPHEWQFSRKRVLDLDHHGEEETFLPVTTLAPHQLEEFCIWIFILLLTGEKMS